MSIFVSYQCIVDGGSVVGISDGFENAIFEDITIEPKDEESLYELTHMVEEDLKRRIGYDSVSATILWWKLL